MAPEFEISSDRERLDIDLIHQFLSTSSYWAQGRTREVVERSIQNSICFGAYVGSRQVAFARVITDHAVHAYLADVFVMPDLRGRGISKALMRAIFGDPGLQGLKWLLGTADAHGLYRQFGFASLAEPDRWMQRFPPA